MKTFIIVSRFQGVSNAVTFKSTLEFAELLRRYEQLLAILTSAGVPFPPQDEPTDEGDGVWLYPELHSGVIISS